MTSSPSSTAASPQPRPCSSPADGSPSSPFIPSRTGRSSASSRRAAPAAPSPACCRENCRRPHPASASSRKRRCAPVSRRSRRIPAHAPRACGRASASRLRHGPRRRRREESGDQPWHLDVACIGARHGVWALPAQIRGPRTRGGACPHQSANPRKRGGHPRPQGGVELSQRAQAGRDPRSPISRHAAANREAIWLHRRPAPARQRRARHAAAARSGPAGGANGRPAAGASGSTCRREDHFRKGRAMIRLWRKNPCHPHHDAAHNGGPVRLEGTNKEVLEAGRNRLVLCAGLFTMAFIVLSLRLVDVTIINQPREPQLDRADRDGVLLATSLATASLYADPKEVKDPEAATRQLMGVLPDLKASEVLDKLKSERRFVWLRRNLTPRQEYEVNRLGIPGLYFQREDRRVYPHGILTAHVVGFTNVDNHGMAGIERRFDDTLSKGGAPLVLSLDLRIQHILREELLAGMEEFKAIGAGGVVLDVHTGEVLAMVSLPDFDANKAGEASDDARFNRMTLGTYELGSVFKVFTVAMALDGGVSTLASSYDASHPLHVARFTISDYHNMHRWLSVPEIFMYSSNIGAAKIALDAGAQMQEAFLRRLGLLSPAKIELPEIGEPEYPKIWRPINTMTIAFGHGISVAPVQVAVGTAAIVDGGILRNPTLLKRRAGQAAPGVRVLSERTSDEMRRLMRLVVTEGTAKEGSTPGYLMGGKTGTAEKATKHGYAHHELVSSFDGVFPMNDPKYVVFAFYDEPHGDKKTHGFATGGWTAVPVVDRVVHRIAPILGVMPIDEKDPQIERALWVQVNQQDRKLASN